MLLRRHMVSTGAAASRRGKATALTRAISRATRRHQ